MIKAYEHPFGPEAVYRQLGPCRSRTHDPTPTYSTAGSLDHSDPDRLDAAIVEVEGDAADALAAQHSASGLLDRLGLGWLDLLADDAIPPSPTIELYERNMIDELALRLVHGSYR
jgi:hypothetical protein